MPDFSSIFPAVVVMGPPHSGKSVLAYLLTRRLWQRRVAHFLLRTAPDGEGNWFYEGTSSTTRLLRLSAKHKYTRKLIRHMLQIIRRRHLPLLVDIGGRPQGEQWDILYACTHGILLHRDPSDLDFWMPRIRRSGLNLLAILESRQRTQDEVIATEPYLQGVISGLERENPHPGRMFELLLEQVETLCAISEEELEALHRQTAPYDMLSETQLARALNKTELPPWWHPADLTRLVRHLPQQPFALYGRGPLWLAAAVAAARPLQPIALFDVHFGWIQVPQASQESAMPLTWDVLPLSQGWFLAMARFLHPFLDYGDVLSPPLPEGARGIILYGKLPKWICASLARHFSQKGVQVAIWEPRQQCAIGVTGEILGRCIVLPVEMNAPNSTQPHPPHPGV